MAVLMAALKVDCLASRLAALKDGKSAVSMAGRQESYLAENLVEHLVEHLVASMAVLLV